MSAARHLWIVSLVLAACAAPVTHWEKPGATAAMVQEGMQEKGYSVGR